LKDSKLLPTELPKRSEKGGWLQKEEKDSNLEGEHATRRYCPKRIEEYLRGKRVGEVRPDKEGQQPDSGILKTRYNRV